MFHTERKHVKGLELDKLNVFEEMRCLSFLGRMGEWQGPLTARPVRGNKEFGFQNTKSLYSGE